MVNKNIRSKKIIIIFLLALVSTVSVYADPYFSGELSLSDTVNLLKDSSDELKIDNSATTNLKLNMDVKSNGVKFYLEELVNNYETTSDLEYTLNKAYLKYRLPYKDGYMNFQVGKSYYALGGGLIYNAGNPMLENSFATDNLGKIPTSWNGVLTLPLYSGEDFDTLYLGFMAILPIEADTSKVGAFLNYEVGNKYFDNFELAILSDLDLTRLTFGFNGTLYADYGINSNIDLQDTDDFNVNIFLTKVYDKLTFNLEALYENKTDRLYSTPSITYAASDKLSLALSNSTIIVFGNNNTYMNTLGGSLQFSIVQGFEVSSTLSTSFTDTNITSLTLGTTFSF